MEPVHQETTVQWHADLPIFTSQGQTDTRELFSFAEKPAFSPETSSALTAQASLRDRGRADASTPSRRKNAPRPIFWAGNESLWETILERQSVDITDNFFAPGDNSLAALCLMVRIRQQFRQDLTFSALFEGATIEHHLASILQRQTPAMHEQHSPLVAIQSRNEHWPGATLRVEPDHLYSLLRSLLAASTPYVQEVAELLRSYIDRCLEQEKHV